MISQKIKFWDSLSTRFAVFFIGLLMTAIIVAGYLVYRSSIRVITDYSNERLYYISELAINAHTAYITEVSNDIALLSTNPVLEDYVAEEKSSLKKLERLFYETLRAKPNYFQIRLLNVRERGLEHIRFEKANGEIIQNDEESLQLKGDRDYYQEALKIPKDQSYFSPINLNEEYDKVSLPHIPTLRAAHQIYTVDDSLRYLLVINVDVGPLFDEYDELIRSGIDIALVDQDGQYLYHSDAAKRFTNQLQHGDLFTTDYHLSSSWKDTNGEIKELEDTAGNKLLSFIAPLSPGLTVDQMYLISYVPQEVLLSDAYQVRDESVLYVLAIALLSFVLALIYAKYYANKITKVTNAISRYHENSDIDLDIDVSKQDEIGVLADTFLNLKATIKRQMKALETALGEERKAKKMRDDFLQNMSHEIRTPLNTILGMSQLLDGSRLDFQQRSMLAAITRSSKNLSGLVYDILDHRKLMSGELNLSIKPVDVSQMLNDLKQEFEYEALQKSITLELITDQILIERVVLTDELRLHQILANLIMNAIKYTDKGSVKIMAGHKNNVLNVSVADTGVGISQDEIEKINDKYYQINDHIDGRYGSYGIGLSIVKDLLKLFNGSLSVSSEIGQGSVFSFDIPAHLGSDQRLKAPDSKQLVPSFSDTKTILLLEDDPMNRELIKYVFDSINVNILQSDNINDVHQKLDDYHVHLIMTDRMLHQQIIDENIRELCINYKEIPVIIISAFDEESEGMGESRYFQKPYDNESLRDAVVKILGVHEFEMPDFQCIINNFESDKKRLSKYMSLLHHEMGGYIDIMKDCFFSQNQNEWDAIRHKIMTHLKELSMTSAMAQMPPEISKLTHSDLDEIVNSIKYTCCCIRDFKRLSLID